MPSAAGAVPEILSRYPGLAGADFALLRGDTLNEPYGVRGDAGQNFVLKIYRSGWRGSAEVDAEIVALARLGEAGAPVVVPVADSEGRLHGEVARPEGSRCYTLTPKVEGDHPGF